MCDAITTVLLVLLLLLLFLAGIDYVIGMLRINSRLDISRSHVLVTGGNSGIGLAIGKQFASAGANVTLLARNKLRLAAAKVEVEKSRKNENQKVLSISADLTEDFSKLQLLINEAAYEAGPIDILINCAGFSICGTFNDSSPEVFRTMMETNYLGSVFITKCVVPSMMERKNGHIVFVSSMGGLMGVYGYTTYCPSKCAFRGLAECLFSEVKPYNIGVSIAFPPDTDTPGFENENRGKPEITKRISESAGLFSSDQVAESIISGIKNRQFLISCGFDCYFLKTLTCGSAPPTTLSEFLIQVFLMGILRVVVLFYLLTFDRIIKKCLNEDTTKRKQT